MSASERRANARTVVVWDALTPLLETGETLDVLDIGGGTGGSAVRIAGLGHRVVVVDPSPDALAALDRRASEAGVAVDARQGDLAALGEVVKPGAADVVLCHGVLEVVPDPAAALVAIREVLRPGGRLSLLVRQRSAAVLARALAGRFDQAQAILGGADEAPASRASRAGRPFSRDEVTGLLADAGLVLDEIRGVRVFADLVPGSVLDLEPGTTGDLVALEQAAAQLPDYLPLAAQLHLLATR